MIKGEEPEADPPFDTMWLIRGPAINLPSYPPGLGFWFLLLFALDNCTRGQQWHLLT
jgi:hypothetical protein